MLSGFAILSDEPIVGLSIADLLSMPSADATEARATHAATRAESRRGFSMIIPPEEINLPSSAIRPLEHVRLRFPSRPIMPRSRLRDGAKTRYSPRAG